MVKRQQPFSQWLIICHRHWRYSIFTEVTCVTCVTCNYDLDITNILVVSPQIRYIKVFDIMNPPFNEQIWPVPSDFIKSRFHCTQDLPCNENPNLSVGLNLTPVLTPTVNHVYAECFFVFVFCFVLFFFFHVKTNLF